MYRVIETNYRQPIFDVYHRHRNPFSALTFELDAAPLKRFPDSRGYPIYVNLCYFFTRTMQPLVDFRYRLLGDSIVLYDEIHPGLTYPAAGGLFSFVHLGYDPDRARSSPCRSGSRSTTCSSMVGRWASSTSEPPSCSPTRLARSVRPARSLRQREYGRRRGRRR